MKTEFKLPESTKWERLMGCVPCTDLKPGMRFRNKGSKAWWTITREATEHEGKPLENRRKNLWYGHAANEPEVLLCLDLIISSDYLDLESPVS